MFKKLVKAIAAIKTENDRDDCWAQIEPGVRGRENLVGRPRNAVQPDLDDQCGGLNDEML